MTTDRFANIMWWLGMSMVSLIGAVFVPRVTLDVFEDGETLLGGIFVSTFVVAGSIPVLVHRWFEGQWFLETTPTRRGMLLTVLALTLASVSVGSLAAGFAFAACHAFRDGEVTRGVLLIGAPLFGLTTGFAGRWWEGRNRSNSETTSA